MFESLRSLSDHELITRTEKLSAHERTVTLKVLVHLNEIERRQLNLKLGFATLFDYCTRGLGYSTGSAWRRIETARCIARFPEVFGLLESNQVNLSTVAQVAKILTAENKDSLLSRIRGKSQREVEAIAAEYEPKRMVPRDKVRTIFIGMPAPVSNFRSGNKPDGSSASSELQPVSQPHVDAAPAKPLAGAAVLERRVIVQFSAKDELMRKLERARSIASHRLPANATLGELIEHMADDFIEQHDPKARHARWEKRKEQNGDKKEKMQSANTKGPARNIPANVRDQVFVRDKQRCTYVSPDGKRCESTHVLQVDHIHPVARGGPGTIDNLRLLCAYHNRFEANRLMGAPQRSSP